MRFEIIAVDATLNEVWIVGDVGSAFLPGVFLDVINSQTYTLISPPSRLTVASVPLNPRFEGGVTKIVVDETLTGHPDLDPYIGDCLAIVGHYIVNFSNAANSPFEVSPYTTNATDTNLKLPGRGELHYGEHLIENFVRLTENFAAPVAPELNPVLNPNSPTEVGQPLKGQLWFDTSTGYEQFKYYDGINWNDSWLFGGINFADPQHPTAGTFIELTGDDNDVGLRIKHTTNPASGDSIVRITDADGTTERLRVEYDGFTRTANSLEVRGDGVHVNADTGVDAQLVLNSTSPNNPTILLNVGGTTQGSVVYNGVTNQVEHTGSVRFNDPVGINNAAPSGSPVWLEVTGDIQANSQFRGSNQSAAFPTYTFTSDLTTGMYRKAAGTLGFSTGGSETLTLSDTTAAFDIDDAVTISHLGTVGTTGQLRLGSAGNAGISIKSGDDSLCFVDFTNSSNLKTNVVFNFGSKTLEFGTLIDDVTSPASFSFNFNTGELSTKRTVFSSNNEYVTKLYVDAVDAAHAADATLHLTSAQNNFLDGLNLPTLTSTEVNYLIGVTSGIQAQLNTKEVAANKGIANGYASLGADGKIPQTQIPAIAITNTFICVDEADMLTQPTLPSTQKEIGDVAVRTDLNKSFILTDVDATILGNWQELLSPTDAVQSVNGQDGTVILTYTDVGAAPDVHDHDSTYVNVSGDTMTGDLILNADPTVALGAATKQYVDNAVDTYAKRYDIAGGTYGQPTAGAVILRFVSPTSFSFSAMNANGSQAVAGTASTGTAVFSIQKNGSQFATLTFTTSSVGVFDAGTATFAAGDILTIVAPTPQDATLSDAAITLAGVLS